MLQVHFDDDGKVSTAEVLDSIATLEEEFKYWRTFISSIFENVCKTPQTYWEALEKTEALAAVIAHLTYMLLDFIDVTKDLKEKCSATEDEALDEFLHDVRIDADELQTQAINVQWHLDDYLGTDDE